MCCQADEAASQAAQYDLVASPGPGDWLLNILSTEAQSMDPRQQEGPEPPLMVVSWKWSPSLAYSV